MALNIKTIVPAGYSVVASLVFLDSLRFKFTNAPETQTIFGKLDAWASTLGAGGLAGVVHRKHRIDATAEVYGPGHIPTAFFD